ncbi:hypothetical protein [Tsukamurella paurometabola]|uniref:Secreted protein n=1 Tax=Tsukamurella paurometabola TaxID=2061 RepID=A0A3P8MA19_TSUPA|nr:hypothetical protein [Tsukamurella paurometabola]UEA85065.1 hypothetical protein LK411_09730 [Tsukamurella paurometabola]VDR37670.1 Uncharacterised protein [Tsukamurella paurometabola]
MVRKHRTAMLASIAALALLGAGCSNDSKPASVTSSASPSSTTAAHHQTPAAEQPAKPVTGNGGNGGTTKTVTQKPGPARTVTAKPGTAKPQTPGDGGQQEPDCNGPDRGTICNPNHGAGDDPEENGTAPTTTAPQVRDDDPGGKPCTTGMGVSGVYVADDSGGWVCQIG